MAELTNLHNLHPAIAKAVASDPYDAGAADASVTQLIGPPRIRVLAKRHGDKLVGDVSERVWALLGKSVHYVIERANLDSPRMAEQRFFEDVQTPTGAYRISGQIDDFDPATGTLTDWKVTSAWTIVFGDRIKDWEAQLNMYAYLLRRAGHNVAKLEVVAILRDWSQKEAYDNKDYPKIQVVTVPIPLWPVSFAEGYVLARAMLHREADALPDTLLPLCSEEERWAKPTKYAVMLEGQERAKRLLDSHREAIEFIESLSPKVAATASIVQRKGEDVRCRSYCPVRGICGYALSRYP